MLVVESNPQRRQQLLSALRAGGIPAVGAAHVGDFEAWPVGDVVITDAAHFTPFWKTVGARHVLVLANTSSEGCAACAAGASAWIPRTCSPAELLALVRRHEPVVDRQAQDHAATLDE